MKLDTFLKRHGVGYVTHKHPTAFTSQRLAEVEHVPGHEVAKPVIVKWSNGYAMCVLPAPRRLDLAKVADALQDDHVELASEAEMAALFPDCEVGAEPPIGAMFGLQTIVDPELLRDERLTMQAGTHTESISISREDWRRICQPLAAPIAVC
jgi:Ala-tRNA(Pro) deacylase